MRNHPNQSHALDHALSVVFFLLSAAFPALAIAQIGGVS